MEYYNSDQVYEKFFKPLEISKTSLYRAINSGRLKAVKCGKRYVITDKAINNYFSGTDEN
ncbi:helix-turn-helix domain-containing protein [Clostridium sp. 19966]|uniref:helix-turn-helix domain-containing protein n=1 Tax=Clostridium sp. 19966 TaxID=2768166 RepID=UPI0028DE2605|nr:helix-turn-helix domain-containing protein [Clostridium sp. 19966]MDT8715424.1 helix-turn-helix domain-containing protein [Clostridium sp. 19966]